MILAIISHTEHYFSSDGNVVGWGPTVREINHLAPHFNKIYHVACLHKGIPPQSSLGYTASNIEFVPIPPSGGDTFWGKMSVLRAMPDVIKTVNKIIRKVDYFQLRLPTGIGNYLLLWLLFCRPQAKFWVKYAGNWAQKSPPMGYAFQRWFLKKNFLDCKVTINGHWPDQAAHVLTFENPCLTDQERIEGKKGLHSKKYSGILDFVFVGQLNESKGVGKIIEAFRQVKDEPRIGMLHFIGDGRDRDLYEKDAKEAGIRYKFYGFLPKEEVNDMLLASHVLLLPSESEGFPKVVAEGANYGCIPVVSSVSSIPQYVRNNHNGFVISSNDSGGLVTSLKRLISMPAAELEQIAKRAYDLGHSFTYEFYLTRITRDILSPDKDHLNA